MMVIHHLSLYYKLYSAFIATCYKIKYQTNKGATGNQEVQSINELEDDIPF